ncbi:hypothetical protein ACQP2P_12675 [Dactylosporangium sp. CA-139114]|uniref:hypothetical protein n=1 Tax=Dactylosporangium sp. CA-139114 TaxID=3239931 RepID=UPI003D9675F3
MRHLPAESVGPQDSRMSRPGRSSDSVIAVVCAVAVLATTAACGGHDEKRPPLPADPGTVTVVAGQATTLQIGGGADLIIPPGAMTPGAKVSATYRGAPAGALDATASTWSPIELIADPPDAIHGLLTLEFPVPVDKLPDGVDPAIAFGLSTYDPATKTWTPFAATYDEGRHMVVAQIPHFSWWAPWTWDFDGIWRDVAQGFGQLTGARSGPARCNGAAPDWVRSMVGIGNGADIAIHSCVQAQSDVLDVEMVNNRPYGQIMTYGSGVKWGWHDEGDSVEDKARNAVVDHFVGKNQLYIPPLGRASVGILKPAANSSSMWYIGPTALTVGTDLTFYALGKAIDYIPLVGCTLSALLSAKFDLSIGALRDDLVAVAQCVYESAQDALKHGKLDKVKVNKLGSILGNLKKASLLARGIEVAGGLTWKIGDLVADWVVNQSNQLGNGFSVFSKAAGATGATAPPAVTTSTNPPSTGGSDNPPPPVDRTGVVSYNRMSGGAPYWGRSSKGWQGFTAASNTVTVVGVTWNDNNYTHGATLSGVTTRISLCTGVGGGADPCVGRIADGYATVNNTADTRIDFGDVGVTRGNTYYVFYYQPTTDAGNWDLYWWNCPACSGKGRQSAVNSDQNQVVVLGYNR